MGKEVPPGQRQAVQPRARCGKREDRLEDWGEREEGNMCESRNGEGLPSVCSMPLRLRDFQVEKWAWEGGGFRMSPDLVMEKTAMWDMAGGLLGVACVSL